MKKRAFTLVEVLISIVFIMVTAGAVSMTLFTSIRSHARAEAHSLAADALRNTISSFQKTVRHKIVSTAAIEILDSNFSIF